MSKPVTSITIEFERMPGIPHRVMLAFWRGTINPSIIVPFMDCTFRFNAMAGCHPDDTFSWEIGMRLCVKRIGNPVLYRAFRRWMWLKKAQNKCGIELGTGCSQYCDLYAICGLDRPAGHIASEYGKVTVEGDIPEELAWMKSVEVKE